MIEVRRVGERLLIGGRPHTHDEVRDLVERIWAAVVVEFSDSGVPLCPKCGLEAAEDAPGFWVCEVIECDGYHQTVWETRDA